MGPAAKAAFGSCESGESVIFISIISLVEMVYLQEKGRIPHNLVQEFHQELIQSNTGFVIADLTLEIVESLTEVSKQEVPDMPDRIIAATALHLNLDLISRDRKIQSSGITTLW